MMPEDFVTTPPFGYIKLKMPSEPDTSGNSIAWFNMKMKMMPDFGPIHHLRIMTRDTAMGTKFFLVDQKWELAEYNYREYRAALKERRMEKCMEQLGLQIASYDGIPKPSKDLFQ